MSKKVLEKAKIEVEGKKEPIEVMFNPNVYEVSHTVSLTNPSGDDALNPSFNGFSIEDFSVTLNFDTYEKGSDVRKLTSEIVRLGMPTIEGTTTKRPPICRFTWGGFNYRGIIYHINQKFTLFLPDGIPVRAELAVKFKSIMTPEEYAKYKGREACRKLWIVKSGDRLDLIANEALKDPSLWRKIAKENNIDSPLTFPKNSDIGRTLIIPD